MKNEKLLNAIGKIDDNLISGAASDTKTKKKSIWFKWGTLAACLALAVFAGTLLIPNSDLSEKPPVLPMLSISENANEAAGFEGYMAYKISELVNANPWNENMEISTLPVYQNPLSYAENFIVHGADFEVMKAFLLEVANRLGMDTNHLHISDNTPSAEEQAAVLEKTGGDIPDGYFNPTEVAAEENGIRIKVDTSLTAEITFDPAVILPDGYDFTYDSSYEDMASTAEYLKEAYKDLLGMDHPQINIYGGDYDIDLHQGYHIEFYDTAGNITDQILNYNFNRAAFYCDDSGNLFMARIYQPDLSEKMGDYPIISAEEARGLLLNGNYITNVPYEMPGEKYIAKCELVYRTDTYEEYYMPYYRFYVELPGMEIKEDNRIKSYGAYYVPAVQEAYITHMPLEQEEVKVKTGSPIIQETSSETSLKILPLELSDHASLPYFDHHSLVFYTFNNEKLTYYKYDMDTQQTQELGTIQKPSIWSGRHISIDDTLYFTVNTDSLEDPLSHLYKLDLKKNSITELTKESLYQTMIYLDTDGDNVLSYKGDRVNGKPITYIERTDVNTGKQEQIMSNAGYIQNFSCTDDKIYVLCCKDENYVMEVYSLSGTLLSEIDFRELSGLFDDSYIGTVKVFGEYIFIGNESLNGALFRLNHETAELMFYSQDWELLLANPGNSENLALSSYVYLYQTDTPYIFIIDVEKSEVYRKELFLDSECPYLDNFIGNDNLAFVKTADSAYEKQKTYLVEGAIYAKDGTEKDMSSSRNYNLDDDLE